MRTRARLALLVAVGILAAAGPGAAFEVGSLVTDPCHERITIAGYLLTTLDIPRDRVEVPPPGPWLEVAQAFAARFRVTTADDVELFFLHSLILGSRANDTDGHSTLDLSALRQLHLYPEGQYEHCLRTADDDGEAGNVAAVAGCRRVVLAHLDESASAAALPRSEQIVRVPLDVDFYGGVEVEAWAPAFALGQALHVLQDSFAHTVRTEDLRGIL